MAKGYSGLFSNTKGAKKFKEVSIQEQKERAFTHAKQIFCNGTKAEKKILNTVAVVYDEEKGIFYYGMNGGITLHGTPQNAILFGDGEHIGLLPPKSLNKFPVGHCAEIDAVNNALNAGAELKNLHLTTIYATKRAIRENKIIPKESCENCTHALRGRIKRNNTGWRNN